MIEVNAERDLRPDPEHRSEESRFSPSIVRVPRVLVAEDDRDMCHLIAWSLERAGYEVLRCYDGMQLADHLGSYLLSDDQEQIDLVISDIRMPYVTGLEILEGFAERRGFPPMILITAFGNDEIHDEAKRLDAVAFFDKPFVLPDLVAKVTELLPVGDTTP